MITVTFDVILIPLMGNGSIAFLHVDVAIIQIIPTDTIFQLGYCDISSVDATYIQILLKIDIYW